MKIECTIMDRQWKSVGVSRSSPNVELAFFVTVSKLSLFLTLMCVVLVFPNTDAILFSRVLCFTRSWQELWSKGVHGLGLFKINKKMLCSPRLYLCFQKYSKNSKIVKYYYNLNEQFSIWIYLKNTIYLFGEKLNFLHYYSSLQCHMIL